MYGLRRPRAAQIRQRAGGHADRRADLGLAAALRARDERVVGDDVPDRPGGEQAVGHVLVGPTEPLLAADEHAGNDAAGAGGRRRDDASHGRVHLGDGQRVAHREAGFVVPVLLIQSSYLNAAPAGRQEVQPLAR